MSSSFKGWTEDGADTVDEMGTVDVEKMREMFTVASSELPKLLTAISQTLFSPEATGQYAKAVADFYKSLREAGMADAQAYELTKEFMHRTNFATLIQEMMGRRGGGRRKEGGPEPSDVEEAIKERIEEKLRESKRKSGEG